MRNALMASFDIVGSSIDGMVAFGRQGDESALTELKFD